MAKQITILESVRSTQTIASEELITELVALERKTEKGHYRYITPKQLDADTAKLYEASMDKIFGTYSSLLRELVGYLRKNRPKGQSQTTTEWKAETTLAAGSIAGAVLPMAALVERNTTAQVSVTTPSPELLDLVDTHVPQTLSPATETFALISYAPRNELEILESILFELSAQPSDEIDTALESMNINDKFSILRGYLTDEHTEALRTATYTWEVIETIMAARNIQTSVTGANVQFQEITPRHGYDVPEIVEEAGLSDLFERCFDKSYELYSTLQAAGFRQEAELAVLLGHRVRWRLHADAANLRRADVHNYNTLARRFVPSAQDAHPTLFDT